MPPLTGLREFLHEALEADVPKRHAGAGEVTERRRVIIFFRI
jgi:hypothetical protein